jgi:hypothetical protein
MTTYNILIEGTTIPVPEEIGSNDDSVRRALAPFYPDAANALITRVEKDDVITVNVVKRAGTKGADPLTALIDCPGGMNPAIALFQQLQELERASNGPLEAESLLELDQSLEQAIHDGEEQREAVESARNRLQKSAPCPAPALVTGF